MKRGKNILQTDPDYCLIPIQTYDSANDQLLPSNKWISFPLNTYRPLAREIFNLLEHYPNLKDLRPCYETIHSKIEKCNTCDPFEKFRVKPKPDDTVRFNTSLIKSIKIWNIDIFRWHNRYILIRIKLVLIQNYLVFKTIESQTLIVRIRQSVHQPANIKITKCHSCHRSRKRCYCLHKFLITRDSRARSTASHRDASYRTI